MSEHRVGNGAPGTWLVTYTRAGSRYGPPPSVLAKALSELASGVRRLTEGVWLVEARVADGEEIAKVLRPWLDPSENVTVEKWVSEDERDSGIGRRPGDVTFPLRPSKGRAKPL
jgi:hypothetical protein